MKQNKKLRKNLKIIIPVVLVISIVAGLILLSGTPLLSYDLNHSYAVKDAGNKIVFIIPGAGETEERFKTIEGYYKSVSITPVFINIDWRLTHITDFNKSGAKEITRAASLYPGRDYYFFGFSFGAIVALNNAGKYHSKSTILCSLSPLFIEDMKYASSFAKTIFKLTGFPHISYCDIPEESTVFLYGDKDNSMIRSKKLVNLRMKRYRDSRFIVIKGAKHDITGTAYLKQIKREIDKLKTGGK